MEKMDIIRMVIALVAQYKWTIFQMDVKSTFLNGYVDEEIYVGRLKVLKFQVKKTKFTG